MFKKRIALTILISALCVMVIVALKCFVFSSDDKEDMTVDTNSVKEMEDTTKITEETEPPNLTVEEQDIKNDEEFDIVYTVESYSDQVQYYESLSDLAEKSEHIIMGEVQKIYSDFNKMGNIFTRYFVTIKEIYKGDLSVSETIEISMPGGVVPLKEYSENTESYVKKDWEDIDEANYETGYIEEICDEEPLPKVKEKCILFLKKIKEYEPETIYMAIGNYQGRFVVEENRINRLLPKGEKDTFNVDTLEKLKSELK